MRGYSGTQSGGLVGRPCHTALNMTRYTTFRFCLDPTVEQQTVFARHAGAARFAYNHCLRSVKTALTQRKNDPDIEVPWTGFDLINTFNKWKKTEDAGRVFAVDPLGAAEVVATGLPWRHLVHQQVFEEAAVDCGRALSAWSDSRSGKSRTPPGWLPPFKKKHAGAPSFRLRNKHRKGGSSAIRIGDGNRPRSVTLPGLGMIAVHDDTRRLRRMLAKNRAKILYATLSHSAGRWWISLNVEAADLHPARHHPVRTCDDHGGWVGVDRGLSVFLVAATADGREIHRVNDAPKALARGLRRQRRLARSLSRKKKGSFNRRDAAARLGQASPPRCQCPPPLPSPGLERARQDPRPASNRRPQCDRHAAPITGSPERSRMPAGPSSPGNCATNRPGGQAPSRPRTAGIRQANSARAAVRATPS